MSFLSDYFDVMEGSGENAVLCPFPHYTPETGLAYFETRPSAHVNTDEQLFHCKACGAGYNQLQFIEEIFGCDYRAAKRVENCFDTTETEYDWEQETLSDQTIAHATSLGIRKDIITELKIKTPRTTDEIDTMAFPVIMYGHLCDVRKYNPKHTPKIKSRKNDIAGLIIPFDLWRETRPERTTLICAGEKDMAVARSHGFNAITITGGENTEPVCPKLFEGRKVAIVYDNDGAGIQGAIALATQLYKYTQKIKVVTEFHSVCKNKGEDITDFFTKYEGTKEQLIQMIEATEYFNPNLIATPTDANKQTSIKKMTLMEASKPENIGKLVQSNIQVVAVNEATYVSTAQAIAKKFLKPDDDKGTMELNEERIWDLKQENIQDILELIDNNFTENNVNTNLKRLMKIPANEEYVQIIKNHTRTVFKCVVTDMFETLNLEVQPMEYTAYAMNDRLESGKKYLVTYKLVPHPYKGQQLTMLITEAKTANDSVSNFKLTQKTKDDLNQIRNMPGTISEKIETMTEKVKGLLGYNGNNTLIQALDFAYNTALEFNFGRFDHIRGYLDTIIVGESRVGKSSTAECLRKTYQLGVFTSLAGAAATIPGLVGGSNKTQSGFQTRAGVIPQNHRGLIVFEEFGKSKENVIGELTDIRSSNEVRITRVSGSITLPAMVRMIALTNTKSTDAGIRPITMYPNGISVIQELVSTAEDIARYDLIVILPDRGASQIDPLWVPETPFDQTVYQARIRWIWSRTPEQIQISDEVSKYIMRQANNMNMLYDCHIKIFGTEAWKKIARLSIAIAGYVVSTSDDMENIVVTKECVDYAISFMKRIYDNSTFKLKEYVAEENAYSTVTDSVVSTLQNLYTKTPATIEILENESSTTQTMLYSCTGMSRDELGAVIGTLVRTKCVRLDRFNIYPTERFRKAIQQINKRTVIERDT